MLTSTNSQVSEVSGVQANAGAGFADTPTESDEISMYRPASSRKTPTDLVTGFWTIRMRKATPSTGRVSGTLGSSPAGVRRHPHWFSNGFAARFTSRR